jgi:hypothetical protein
METLILVTVITLSGVFAIASTRALLGVMLLAMTRGVSRR